MGLFDNIFLDQNSATAMLDPLLENGKSPSTPEAKKPADKPIEAPQAEVVAPTETAIEAVSFDDIAPPSAPVEAPKGFLSGGDPTTTISDDVSFDIGGFDLPVFSPDGGSQEASISTDMGSTPAITMMDTSSEVASTATVSDTSIALVQGATSATSDAIIDTPQSTTSTDALQSAGITLIQEPIAPAASVTPVEVSIPSVVDMTVSTDSADVGLMGLFASDVAVEQALPVVSTVEEATTTVSPTTEAISLDSNVSDIALPSLSLTDSIMPTITQAEEVALPSYAESTPVSSSDIAEILTSSMTSSSSDSPLHEMLTEFIAKLEKFNTESATLDTEMVATESALLEEQEELKREFDVRMSAIEYKRKHMEQTRSERKVEKARLERIISNLKQEVA